MVKGLGLGSCASREPADGSAPLVLLCSRAAQAVNLLTAPSLRSSSVNFADANLTYTELMASPSVNHLCISASAVSGFSPRI